MIVFKRLRISKKKFNLIVRCFATDIPASKTAFILRLNRNTVNRYYYLLRRLIIQEEKEKRRLFLVEQKAEVDEAYFGPRRVRGKRGRGAGRKIVVVGILKRDGQVYAKIISSAEREEILPLILACVKKGSDIYTDGSLL